MVVLEALKGAQVELASVQGVERLRLAARLAVIFAAELAGIASTAGFGLRAWRTYRSLPGGVGGGAGGGPAAVRVVRDVRSARSRLAVCGALLSSVAASETACDEDPCGAAGTTADGRAPGGGRYGPRQREVLDLYLPAAAGAPGGQAGPAAAAAGAPVALFCHGGVWASGEKWHYAPMGARLAEAGILVGVLSYTLYPQARAPQMAAEVSAALSWALDHAAEYGGDPRQITALGHSAGAHLWFMALLGRARAARRRGSADARMPARFVGMAGVYDIGAHYRYEAARGVALLSTMARAVAGANYARDGAAPPPPDAFAAQSPARLLARAAGAPPASRAPALAGQALAARLGFGRAPAPGAPGNGGPARPRPNRAGGQAHDADECMSSREAAMAEPESCACDDARAGDGSGAAAGGAPAGAGARGSAGKAGPAAAGRAELTLADTARLPPSVLLSSCADVTVPWHESAEMYWRLVDCGVPAAHLVYPRLGHAAYVTAWRPRPAAGAAGGARSPTPRPMPAACGGAAAAALGGRQGPGGGGDGGGAAAAALDVPRAWDGAAPISGAGSDVLGGDASSLAGAVAAGVMLAGSQGCGGGAGRRADAAPESDAGRAACAEPGRADADLPDFARDLVAIMTGRVRAA